MWVSVCRGAALATENGSAPDVRVLAVCAVAATTLRTLAIVVNDLLDKDFDAKASISFSSITKTQ